MKYIAGFILYACAVLYVITNVLGLAWALAVQLLVLSVLLFAGFMGYAWITGKDEES